VGKLLHQKKAGEMPFLKKTTRRRKKGEARGVNSSIRGGK